MKKMWFGTLLFVAGLLGALTVISVSFMKYGIAIDGELNGIFGMSFVLFIGGFLICLTDAYNTK